MSELARRRMTSDEFIAWAMEQPETEHYELIEGEVVAMAPERSGHSLTKFHIARRMAEAIEAGHQPCRVYPDGMATKVTDPVIVVEVLPPPASSRDVGPKLMDYFRLPSLRHYLIVLIENRTIVHHERSENGIILTRIVRDEPIMMNSPGITLADCFPPGVA